MARYVVATVDDIAPGQRKLVQVQGRDIRIFNVRGEFFAIANRCPHEGASLCKGRVCRPRGIERTGVVSVQPAHGEMIRCPGMVGNSTCVPENHGAIRNVPRFAPST